MQSLAIYEVFWRSNAYRFVVADENDEIQRDYVSGKIYEQEELDLLVEAGRRWTHMVDVGANVGNHCIALNNVFDFHRIDIFEPNADTAELLRLNIVLNTHPHRNPFNLKQIYRVVSDTNDDLFLGEARFPSNLGSMAYRKVETHREAKAEPASLEQGGSRSVTLDYALGPSCRADFLKIDVEGMEMEVLRGAIATISKCMPDIYIEVMDENICEIHGFCDKYNYEIIFEYKRYSGLVNYLMKPKVK